MNIPKPPVESDPFLIEVKIDAGSLGDQSFFRWKDPTYPNARYTLATKSLLEPLSGGCCANRNTEV